jgi:hypothetical protein
MVRHHNILSLHMYTKYLCLITHNDLCCMKICALNVLPETIYVERNRN